MRNVKVYTKEGSAPDKEELAAALIAVTAFRDKAVGVFPYTHNGIGVEYHPHKLIAYVQGNISIYFGANQSVDMRCKCKGIVLAETAAPAEPSAKFRIVQNDTRFNVIEVSVIDHKGSVINVIQGTQTIVGGDAPNYIGATVTINNLPFIYTPPGVAASIPDVPLEFQLASGVITNLGQLNEARSGTAFEVEPTYQVLKSAAAAEANQRSAVFLTDGTELVSAPIERTLVKEPPFPIYDESNTLPYKGWLGGSQVPLYVRTKQGNTLNKYTRTGSMSFDIPDDACVPHVFYGGDFYHLGDENQTVYRITRDNSVNTLSDVSYGGYYSKQVGGVVVNQVVQMSVLVSIVNEQIKPALEREHKRRKKCSDGQMAYLRNGFMSPEIERFVKAYHPVSNLLRRDIAMQIISEPVHTLINEERDEDGALIASTYECRLTLKYLVENTEYQKDFVGQVRFTEYTATYTNYPLLGFKLNGTATPEDSDFRGGYNVIHFAITSNLSQSASLKIIHDEDSYYPSLFCEVNGTGAYNERWFDEFYEMGPTPDVGYLPGEIVKTSFDNVTFSYPQILLDYIAASKPIETEIDENGNKVPVTPSTDWLSSRLTDKEVIKVIPLNHVGNSYGNYGMFPLMQRDAEDNLIVNELRIYGYAEFQYRAETTSFTFKKWVELIDDGKLTILADDEVSLDDDLNPTTISVTSNGETKTYNLAPKSFEYDEEWGATNCVCIGNKAIW
ncbi:MAG: hypothetical protein CTY38_06025, partial [Methylotenera sp.]|uniref:hypothetical protein n=1 Tax=Methylotenera sp. TaxID=2051956 RepID=UPI000D491759